MELRLRDRDTEDGRHRKAVRQTERGWRRVRLAELYGASGAVVPRVSIGSTAVRQRLWYPSLEADTTFIALAFGQRGPCPEDQQDARNRLDEALDAFALEHGIVDIPAEPRTRSSDKTRARILRFTTSRGMSLGE